MQIKDERLKSIYEYAIKKATEEYKAIPKSKVTKYNQKDFVERRGIEALKKSGAKVCAKGHYHTGECSECNESREAMATSAMAQVTRKGIKKESFKFLEAQIQSAEKRIAKVIILKEGPGNAVDKNYYSIDALKSAVPQFEGAQCYADHPTSTEEIERPVRSVKDVIGYFSEVKVESIKGANCLTGLLKINQGDAFDWAWNLIKVLS